VSFGVVDHKRNLRTEIFGVKNCQHGVGSESSFRGREKDNVAKKETRTLKRNVPVP
jgi:hypothetical protein